MVSILLRSQLAPQLQDINEAVVQNAKPPASCKGGGLKSEVEWNKSTSFDSGLFQMVELGSCNIETTSGLCPFTEAVTSTATLFKPINERRE